MCGQGAEGWGKGLDWPYEETGGRRPPKEKSHNGPGMFPGTQWGSSTQARALDPEMGPG